MLSHILVHLLLSVTLEVVYCSSLPKSYVQELLNDYNIDSSHVKLVKTSSSDKNELWNQQYYSHFPQLVNMPINNL